MSSLPGGISRQHPAPSYRVKGSQKSSAEMSYLLQAQEKPIIITHISYSQKKDVSIVTMMFLGDRYS
jgi:hypothetical protein